MKSGNLNRIDSLPGEFTSQKGRRALSVKSRFPRSTSARQTAPANRQTSTEPPKDPFAEKEVYHDSPIEQGIIWIFSKLLKKQLGPKFAGEDYGPGYEGFVELSKNVMKGRNSEQQREAIGNILSALLPPEAAARFRRWFPLSKWSAETNAWITTLGFYWLVGPMKLQEQEVDFKGKTEVWKSGVLISKCRYLEVSGCKGMCINMCKRPTQSFFTDTLGLPLTMTPNFEDLSCEMKFGVPPPQNFEDDEAFREPCFIHNCSIADRDPTLPCPKIDTERWKRT